MIPYISDVKEVEFMKVAVSINAEGKIYKGNPWTAPKFVIYEVIKETKLVTYQSVAEIENPWLEEDESVICDPMMCNDGCSDVVKADLNHLADHYIILEAIHGCNYLLANTFCSNVEKVLENGGIEIHQFPIFMKLPEQALKNFINTIFSQNNNHITFRVEKKES